MLRLMTPSRSRKTARFTASIPSWWPESCEEAIADGLAGTATEPEFLGSALGAHPRGIGCLRHARQPITAALAGSRYGAAVRPRQSSILPSIMTVHAWDYRADID